MLRLFLQEVLIYYDSFCEVKSPEFQGFEMYEDKGILSLMECER